jgi:hypothetical protein
MNQTAIDYGQAQIAAFGNAAAVGEVRYDPDVARQAAAEYQKMIVGLQEIRVRLEQATRAPSFGGFDSAGQLEKGFTDKAVQGLDVLDQLMEGAMRLREAYFRAGNLLQEADDQNAALLRFIEQGSETA